MPFKLELCQHYYIFVHAYSRTGKGRRVYMSYYMSMQFAHVHMQHPLRTQSANSVTRYLSHRVCGCPPEGRRYQQHNLYWPSYHKQFRFLNQVLSTFTRCDM